MFFENNFVFSRKICIFASRNKFTIMLIQLNERTIEVNNIKEFVTIFNGYTITSINDMKNILKQIKEQTRDTEWAIHKRSINSMINEWRAHNLLNAFCPNSLANLKFSLQHIDLEYPQSVKLKIAYAILNLFYWKF